MKLRQLFSFFILGLCLSAWIMSLEALESDSLNCKVGSESHYHCHKKGDLIITIDTSTFESDITGPFIAYVTLPNGDVKTVSSNADSPPFQIKIKNAELGVYIIALKVKIAPLVAVAPPIFSVNPAVTVFNTRTGVTARYFLQNDTTNFFAGTITLLSRAYVNLKS